MKKPSYGVVVARFQVHELHEGHLELIRAVRQRHNRVILFIGCAPIPPSVRNPLDFATRRIMIQELFPDITIAQLPDVGTDEAWSRMLDERIREIAQTGDVTLYGGRDSFVPHYHGGFTPVELPLNVSEHISGEELRVQVGDSIIAHQHFRAGAIYATQNRYPICYPCVDVAMVRRRDLHVLLGRKKYEKLWRFPGGHVMPGESFERAAQRELNEETEQLTDVANLKYVGSFPVDDWRYRNETDGITTAFFTTVYVSGPIKAADDLDEVAWQPLDFDASGIVHEHQPLWAALRRECHEHPTRYR
jgi:bifunctional NMN adenylyltransferase/nudix hydrolase